VYEYLCLYCVSKKRIKLGRKKAHQQVGLNMQFTIKFRRDHYLKKCLKVAVCRGECSSIKKSSSVVHHARLIYRYFALICFFLKYNTVRQQVCTSEKTHYLKNSHAGGRGPFLYIDGIHTLASVVRNAS
jgi:hypothetical protein